MIEMRKFARNLVVRVLMPTLILFSLSQGAAAFYGIDETVVPGTAVSESGTPTFHSVDEAEEYVRHEYLATLDYSRCWEREEDRIFRTPSSAVVKWDETVKIREIDVDEVVRLADDGKVWVLAWCEKKGV